MGLESRQPDPQKQFFFFLMNWKSLPPLGHVPCLLFFPMLWSGGSLLWQPVVSIPDLLMEATALLELSVCVCVYSQRCLTVAGGAESLQRQRCQG